MDRNRTPANHIGRAQELIGVYDVTGSVLIATVEEIRSEGLYKRGPNTRIIADALAG
jgi:hypothetical protein